MNLLKNKIFWIIFALVVVAGVASWRLVSRPPKSAGISEAGIYKNAKLGFSVSYPKWWVLEEPKSLWDSVLIYDKLNNAQIVLRVFDSKGDDIKKNFAVMSGLAKDGFFYDKAYKLESFRRTFFGKAPAYVASGKFNDGKVEWNFQEYGIFPENSERYYKLRADVKSSFAKSYEAAIADIVKFLIITSSGK